MWKRMNQGQRDRQASHSDSPSLSQTSALDKPLPPTGDLYSGDISKSSGPAVNRKGPGDVLKDLPGLPDQGDSLQIATIPRRRPVSTVPTASSVYSQPSPEMGSPMDSVTAQQPRSSSNNPEDVSPPDSPVGSGYGHGHSRRSSYNVSPISTDNPNPFASRSPTLKQGRYNSNLPVPKTKKFWKLPDKAPTSPDQDSTTVRWDEYSGEPTSSDKGKPPSTTPGAVRLNEDPTPGRLNSHNFGTSTHISGGAIARKRVGSREISETPIQMRPEWKGAGGRHAIVAPPIDKPLPPGQSPTFSMGQRKKQLIEEEKQADLEREENENQEHQRAEQARLEAERRELQRHEEERTESRRRDDERAEQARHDKEREEEERRTREKVVQARRERDIAQQAQRAKDAAARRAQREEAEAAQRAQNKNDESLQKEGVEPEQRSGLGLAFHPTTRNEPMPLSGHLDTNELAQARTAFGAVDGNSSDSVSSSTSESKARHLDVSSMADDKRSPLARNPSNEEMQGRRSQPLPDLPPTSQPQQYSPRTPTNQFKEWKQRTSSLPKDEQVSSLIESRFRADLQNMAIQEEPKSRFSTTTYATTAYNDSPPATPENADTPALPTSTTSSSILNRRRPVPTSGVTPHKLNPSETSTPTSAPYSAATPDTDKVVSKVLPKAPTGAPKVDQVKTLEARKDALRRRRGNIETVIHELTDVVQPSSIAYDKASRQEIKKTVEQLKRELAEVIKDEHETGLKLHRAWKRHADFADFEPTSIWVRRVTH